MHMLFTLDLYWNNASNVWSTHFAKYINVLKMYKDISQRE